MCKECCGCVLPEVTDEQTFIGSGALMTALHDTYVEHIGIVETEGPDGPYLWCACGWRSDDLDGHGTKSDNPGLSYAVHLTNAQHAAAVKALQPIVVRRSVLPEAEVTEEHRKPATPVICTCPRGLPPLHGGYRPAEPCPKHPWYRDKPPQPPSGEGGGSRTRYAEHVTEWTEVRDG